MSASIARNSAVSGGGAGGSSSSDSSDGIHVSHLITTSFDKTLLNSP